MLRPFIGDAGQFLRDALIASGASPERIRISNIAKSFPGRDSQGVIISPPPRAQIDRELPFLIAEIQRVSPVFVLALGGTAIKELTGHRTVEGARSSSAEVGGVLPLLADFHHSAHVIPTWHPSHIRGRGRADEPRWRDDIRRFAEACGG